MPRKKTVKKASVGITDSPEVIQQKLDECYQLHSGQVVLHDQVFKYGKKRIFAQCGRSWGKSVSDAKISAEYACLKSNSHCYIILPEKTQAKEIFWDSGLLKGMIPDEYILKDGALRNSAIKSELRIRLVNGSFIKLLGADNPDSLRGIKPHFCIYDEYRDFKSKVYWSMEANLAGKDATLIITSTPPDVAGDYSELRAHFLTEINRGNSKYFYIELPTESNPHINKDTLTDIKRRLVAHGQLRVWEREYMAKFIPGGASAVFPMFADRKDEIYMPAFLIEELVRNDRDTLDFYALFDPASSSVFAVLIAAINRYTSQVYCIDEIYERDRNKTSSIDMWKRANEKKGIYLKNLTKWENVYDEHESWFARDLDRYEILQTEGTNLEPTTKQSRDKNEDLAIVKDLMLLDKRFFISHKCPNLVDEIESYCTDKEGKIVKRKDHLIDCLSGDTLVDTDIGQVKIKDLVGKTGLVKSRDGTIQKFYGCKRTHENEDVYEIEFETGEKVVATAKHKFLLESGKWKELKDIRLTDSIQYATFKHGNKTNIFREGLLSLWQVFSKEWAQVTQGSLGALQWGYPQGVSCSPYRWGSEQQYSSEFGAFRSRYSHEYPQFVTRKEGDTLKSSQKTLSRVLQTGFSLQEIIERQRTAVRDLKRDVGKNELGKKELYSLWKRIRNSFKQDQVQQVLPSKLQGNGTTTKAKSIKYVGKQDTYCMFVDNTHCFSVEGGIIVHNCLRYLISASGYTPNEQPNYEEYLERKNESKIMSSSFQAFMQNKRKQEDWTSDLDESSVFTDDIVFLEDLDNESFF